MRAAAWVAPDPRLPTPARRNAGIGRIEMPAVGNRVELVTTTASSRGRVGLRKLGCGIDSGVIGVEQLNPVNIATTAVRGRVTPLALQQSHLGSEYDRHSQRERN